MTRWGGAGLAVAAAFAVALAVLVSVSSTSTVEAADVPLEASDNSATAAPGDTVQISVVGTLAQVSITSTGAGVGGSFVANGAQSINCSNDLACDKVKDSTTPGAIQVDLKVDADSAEGFILVSVEGIGGENADPSPGETKVITVSKATLLGSLAVKAAPSTIATDSSSTVTVTAKNAATDAEGLNGQVVTFVTDLGLLNCDPTSGIPGIDGATGTAVTRDATNNTQVCQMVTSGSGDDAGKAAATLHGAGREGTATVTVTVGGITKQAAVTIFGDAKNLSAEPMQGSVEIGGSVYVVLTVTDGAGNPVSGAKVIAGTPKEVVGPEGASDDELVTTATTHSADEGNTAGVGYSTDYTVPTDSKQHIPACGEDNRGTTEADERFPDEGTDSKGRCVVKVETTKAGDDLKATARGEHTLHFQVDGATPAVKATAVIEVAGEPATITTDAPTQVDAPSVTEITVSVWDDEDVLVGRTDVKVRIVGGDGLIENAGEGNTEPTTNGQSKFTFIAPSSHGSAEILITAGKINQRISLQIGEELIEIEEPPEPPAAPSLTVTGNLGVFSGGTLAQFEDALNAACPDGGEVWAQSAPNWQFYSTTAPEFVSAGFISAFYRGFGESTPVWVTTCEGN